MKLKIVKKTNGKKMVKKGDGIQEDYRAAVQLELGAKNALRKSKEIFDKIIRSKDASESDVFNAKKQFEMVVEALHYL